MRRLLFVSNLFPDSNQPIRGLDNATLLHAMRTDWEIRVLSPRATLKPWKSNHLTAREQDEIFSPLYVNFAYLPKIGSWCNDHFMEFFLASSFVRIIREFKPDAVLCSWLYPDGCAVARLARQHGVPLVLVTQGSDTHGYLKFPVRRRKIISAIHSSGATICRSANLAHRLHDAGAEKDKLKVIYNGVDTKIFQIRNRDDARHIPEAACISFRWQLSARQKSIIIDSGACGTQSAA
jgi:teichuronic acid biosynthesis glycosyltransferase TuaC